MRSTMMSSGAPKFMMTLSNGGGHSLPLRGYGGTSERFRHRLDVVERPDVEGHAAHPADQGLDAQARPLLHLLSDLFDRADEATLPPRGQAHPVEHARWTLLDESFEATGQIGFALATQGVEAHGPPDRGGVAVDGGAGTLQPRQALAVLVRRPHPARVPAVGVLDGSAEDPVALAADEQRRSRHLARGRIDD